MNTATAAAHIITSMVYKGGNLAKCSCTWSWWSKVPAEMDAAVKAHKH